MPSDATRKSPSRYHALVEHVFFANYAPAAETLEFARDDLSAATTQLSIELPKNLGDVLYSIRYRTPMPAAILATQPEGFEWIIEGVGRARYAFKHWGISVYRLVVCDLDGTLLNPEHRIVAYTRDVLRRLLGLGIDLMLASGRHYGDLHRLSAELGARGGLISSNGAAVHDAGGRLVHHQPLDPACLGFLLHDPAFDSVHVNLYRIDDWLVERPEPHLLQYHQESGFAYRVVDFADLDAQPVLKVFYYGDRERLSGLEGLVHERCPGRLATTFSLPETLEVMAAGVSKGAALERVAAALGLTPAEVIAFGDAMDDLELLRGAGKGVVMGNADPRLKAALMGHEVIGTNAEESVARYLEALLLVGSGGGVG